MVVRSLEHTLPYDDDCVTDNNMVCALFGNLALLATTCVGPCYGLSANAAWAAHCPNCPHTEAARLDLPVQAFEGHSEEYEFALDGMREHWQSGLDDMRRTQADPCRLDQSPPEFGIVTHEFHREEDRS